MEVASYPFLSIKHKLREAQGSCTQFWWMVMNHVIVQQGQLEKVFSKGVFLSISLEDKRKQSNKVQSANQHVS